MSIVTGSTVFFGIHNALVLLGFQVRGLEFRVWGV